MPIIVPIRIPSGNGVADLVFAILYLGVCVYGLYTLYEVDGIHKGIHKQKKPIAKPIAADDSFFDRYPVTCVVVGLAVFMLVVLTLTGYWWE